MDKFIAIHVVGIKKLDKKQEKMRQIWKNCEDADLYEYGEENW